MTDKHHEVFSQSRRAALKTAGLTLCAGMLPLGGLALADDRQRRYRRYNATGKHGKRMLKSYAKAVRAMLALPPEDPRNWYRQAIVHTMDCPHGNWWFLPWHRAYLGWFEQICRELSGDPQFALPYWDWTVDQQVPDDMFDDVLDPNHPAYLAGRQDFERLITGVIAGAGYWSLPGSGFDGRSQLGQLLSRRIRFEPDLLFDMVTDPRGGMFFDQPGARGIRREQPGFSLATADAVSPATIQAALAAPDFVAFGSAKTSNHHTSAGFGILEARPHNSIHRCVGSRDCNFVEARGFMTDMLSPVDPIFFLHHGNMDRLWDVWTRKQMQLGLPFLPAGYELRTDLPDEQKSAAERASDYYRWARDPLLFFVNAKGQPVSQTRAGGYAWMTPFGYDYEPGSGEELIPRYAVAGQSGRRARVVGSVQRREVSEATPASAVAHLPGATVEAARTGGQVLVANVTLNFPQMSHDAFMVILNGPDDLSHVDASSPHYLATIMMFGHRGAHGALTYSLPLSEKLRQLPPGDGKIRLRVVPMCGPDCHEDGHDHQHHDKVHGDAVELVAVSIEAY